MSSFVYSPQIRAFIATDRDTYDVSHDISEATVTRRKGVSSFSLTLSNHRRKYDGVFSPMDRVTIYLKRIGPFLLVMSGYLDSVPVYSTYSSAVRINGSCSLKRLQHWAWDPMSQAGAELLTYGSMVDGQDPSVTDGGVAQRVTNILDKVMGWPSSKVHIGAVPTEWFDTLGSIGETVIAEAEMAEMISLAGAGALAGTVLSGTSVIAGVGPGTGTLPAQIVRVGTFGGSNGEPGYMSLTREPIRRSDSSRGEWGGQYYIQAPWPFRDADGSGIAEGVDASQATTWWRNRPIMLTNPRTSKVVIARAAHWGPGGASDYVRVSRPTYNALGLEPGQAVHMAFPPSSLNNTSGPVDPATGESTQRPSPLLPGASGANYSPDTSSGLYVQDTSDMPKHPVAATVNTFAALEDFLRWCVNHGITPTEHPLYGGVTPGYHASIEEGGFHWWPAPHGGGAADLVVPGGGQQQERLLDQAALEASRRNLGVIWKAPNHWNHMHVAVQNSRDIGRLVYASDAELRALPPLRLLDGSPGAPGTNPGGSANGLDPAAIGEALFSTFERMASWNTDQAGRLGGKRALMNDVSLYSTIDKLFKVGLRDWCSAPNGDIIGWFPDYFGKFDTSAKMIIEPVEVADQGFDIEWSDARLKTHMFVTGASSSAGVLLENPGLNSARDYTRMERTAGIASVEYPEMMRALFGLTGDLFHDGAEAFLEKFGARPHWEPMDIITGPRAEFFFSTYRFMKNWSEQYSARVNLTFMPELYPGMVAAFPHWGLQAYVDSVTHTISMETGFNTSVNFIAWSKIKGHPAAIRGLPEGGELR